jgi:signal transduction histidine kinase
MNVQDAVIVDRDDGGITIRGTCPPDPVLSLSLDVGPADVAAVVQLAAELVQLRGERLWAERTASAGMLASVVAHDANNILAPIVLAVDQLLALDRPPVTAPARLIAEGCKRLSSMLRLLLPAARAEGPQSLDVNAVVRSLAGTLRILAGSAVDVCMRMEEPLPAVLMDRLELERAVLNLVANARDAMRWGGEIGLRTASVQLPPGHASGLNAGVWVLIEVRDQGEGMDAATCARAFEPFFTTKPAGRGTGLGLASVRRAVLTASGSVRIVSEVGEGTSVEIWLPRHEDETTAK